MAISKSSKSNQRTTGRGGAALQRADVLEKALKDLGGAEIPFQEKCVAAVDLCDRLEKLYQQNGDAVNATRIQNLKDKAKALIS